MRRLGCLLTLVGVTEVRLLSQQGPTFDVRGDRTYPGPTATPSQRPLFSIFRTSIIIMAADDYNTQLEAALAELAL